MYAPLSGRQLCALEKRPSFAPVHATSGFWVCRCSDVGSTAQDKLRAQDTLKSVHLLRRMKTEPHCRKNISVIHTVAPLLFHDSKTASEINIPYGTDMDKHTTELIDILWGLSCLFYFIFLIHSGCYICTGWSCSWCLHRRNMSFFPPHLCFPVSYGHAANNMRLNTWLTFIQAWAFIWFYFLMFLWIGWIGMFCMLKILWMLQERK